MNTLTDSCMINGKHQVEVVSKSVSYQGQGTLVRITRGGICGSDLHYYQHGKVGNFEIRMPMVLGHEVVGYVVKSDDPSLPAGQKVAINPAAACGECKYCRSGEDNQCTGMRFLAVPCITRMWMAVSASIKWWKPVSVSLLMPGPMKR